MTRQRFQNTRARMAAARVKRKASRNIRSTSFRVSFRIKKVDPQMRVASTIMGFASFFKVFSLIIQSTPGFQKYQSVVYWEKGKG